MIKNKQLIILKTMKQNILRKLMLIAVLLTGVNAFAHDFEFGGIYYNITSSSGLTVEVTYKGSSSGSYSNEYSGQVTIPESVTYNSNTYSTCIAFPQTPLIPPLINM